MNCSIACHVIRLTTGEESAPDLSRLEPGGDLLDIVARQLRLQIAQFVETVESGKSKKKQLEPVQVTYRFSEPVVQKAHRRIVGSVLRGNTGRQKDIRDTLKPGTAAPMYRQKETETDESPLHFMIAVPANRAVAFLFTQKDGIASCEGIVKKVIYKAVKSSEARTWPVEIDADLPEGWIEKFKTETKISHIQIALRQPPKDIADSLRKVPGLELYDMTLVLHPPQAKQVGLNTIFNKLKQYGTGVAKDGFLGEYRVTLDLPDGAGSRTWVVGSDEFKYPVVELPDAKLRKGHVARSYFVSQAAILQRALESEWFKSLSKR